MVEKAVASAAVSGEAKNHTNDMIAGGAGDMNKLVSEAEAEVSAGKKIDQLRMFKPFRS